MSELYKNLSDKQLEQMYQKSLIMQEFNDSEGWRLIKEPLVAKLIKARGELEKINPLYIFKIIQLQGEIALCKLIIENVRAFVITRPTLREEIENRAKGIMRKHFRFGGNRERLNVTQPENK